MEETRSVWPQGGTDSDAAPLHAHAALQRQLQRAYAEIARLERCIDLRDQQLCELRKVLAHVDSVHYSVEVRLQRELDSLRIMGPATEQAGQLCQPEISGSTPGVVIRLPYVTSTLSVLFDAMYTFWAGSDQDHLPKSSTVARAIDERLGLGGQANGEASRSGQAYASAIRPDWVKDADNRHHGRAGVRR